MNVSIRRLALDLSPWVWGYLLFFIVMGMVMDVLWLHAPRIGEPPLIVGFMLTIGTSQSAQKVALWRTLPVSRRQIDLARWQQGVLFPSLILPLMLAVPALVMTFLGTLHATSLDIALLAVAQAGSGAIVFGTMASLPALADRIGRFSVVPWALVIGLVVFSPRFFHGASMRSGLGASALFGLVIALLLYVTVGRWPLPFTGWASLWSRRETKSWPGGPGLSGWSGLLLAQMPMVLICWCMIPTLPLVMRLALRGDTDLSFMALIVLLTCGLLPASAFALSMRGLRALPLSGLALTTRIVTSLVMIQLIGAVIFALTLALLQPGYPPRPNYALLPVALPVLLFALTLRFGPRVAQFGVAIAIVSVSLGAVLLGSLDFSVADTAIAVVMLTGLGFAATYREIISGRHAYRAQPLVPLSWRGR